MLEFPPSLITPSSPSSPSEPHIPLLLVDSAVACLAEAGELHAAGTTPAQLVEIGALLDPSSGAVKDDAETVQRLKDLREGGRSLFKCVGVGGMDVAIARLVVDEAERRGLGARVPF